MNFRTFLTGGAIRDELLGRKPKDYDFVMLAPSFEAMREQLLSEGAKIFVEKPQFLTIRCNHPKLGSVDFAVARGDGIYEDGRHPTSVSIAKTIEEDLSRRDFTIGAIARDVVTGEVIDPFNGRRDIQDKVIQTVGEPKDRFNEDRLRVFRALRFSVVLDFYIDGKTRNAMKQFDANDFGAVSAERVREELHKMFMSDSVESIHQLSAFPQLLQVMADKGVRLEPTLKK